MLFAPSLYYLEGFVYKGKAFKDKLWATTSSTNIVDFNIAMLKIEGFYPSAHQKLLEIKISFW